MRGWQSGLMRTPGKAFFPAGKKPWEKEQCCCTASLFFARQKSLGKKLRKPFLKKKSLGKEKEKMPNGLGKETQVPISVFPHGSASSNLVPRVPPFLQAFFASDFAFLFPAHALSLLLFLFFVVLKVITTVYK